MDEENTKLWRNRGAEGAIVEKIYRLNSLRVFQKRRCGESQDEGST